MPRRNRNLNSSWEQDSPKSDPPRRCPISGKRMYANEREAKSAAAHQMQRDQSPPSHLNVYKCLHCNAYHLTSKDP
jgi:hypothetical protein